MTAEPRVDSAVIIHQLPLMRLGIAAALNAADVSVGGEAATLDAGLDLAFEIDASLLVVGDAVADDAREVIRNDYPAARLVLLLRQATRDDLVALVETGVGGIARRLIQPAQLSDMSTRVCAGEQVVETELVPVIFGGPSTNAPNAPARANGAGI